MLKICRECESEFILTPNKPGKIFHCPACSSETVERLGGNMVFLHKTASTIEIKPASRAIQFAEMTKRFGAGVTKCITTSKEIAYESLGKG